MNKPSKEEREHVEHPHVDEKDRSQDSRPDYRRPLSEDLEKGLKSPPEDYPFNPSREHANNEKHECDPNHIEFDEKDPDNPVNWKEGYKWIYAIVATLSALNS